MFTQFRVIYPKGSLISEFITFNNGKYLVRTLVQVDGITIATGMAGADTIEVAEDQSRVRALAVLGIQANTNSTLSEVVSPVTPKPTTVFNPENIPPVTPSRSFSPSFSSHNNSPNLAINEPNHAIAVELDDTDWEANNLPFVEEPEPDELVVPQFDDTYEFSSPAIAPKISNSPTTPIKNTSQVASSDVQLHSVATPAIATPVDLSELMARTAVEIKRLGWNNEQGIDYLKRTYNKTKRKELNAQELADFLRYLEAQPTPED